MEKIASSPPASSVISAPASALPAPLEGILRSSQRSERGAAPGLPAGVLAVGVQHRNTKKSMFRKGRKKNNTSQDGSAASRRRARVRQTPIQMNGTATA